MYLLRFEQDAERECDQQTQFVSGVVTFNIQRRVRLRQTGALRVCQRGFEFNAPFAHRRQNRVAGAVHDAIDGLDSISRERLAQSPNDWNAAGHAGFEPDRAPRVRGRFEDLSAMLGEQGLVPRNNVFPRLERFEDQLASRFITPEQLDDDIYVGARDELRA